MSPKVFLVLCSEADVSARSEVGIELDGHLSLDELVMMIAMATDMARLYPSPARYELAAKLQALYVDALNSVQFV